LPIVIYSSELQNGATMKAGSIIKFLQSLCSNYGRARCGQDTFDL